MRLRYILVFVVFISLAGCTQNPEKPQNLIAEDTYINLLVELQLVSSYGETAQGDSLAVDSLTTEVFKRYEISGEQFWDSHQYYQQFPTEQKIRVEKAIERLKIDQVSNNSEDKTADQ